MDLTLQKALEDVREVESVRKQQAELNPDKLRVNKYASELHKKTRLGQAFF